MNLIVETNTYGFATGSKYPGCLDQGKVFHEGKCYTKEQHEKMMRALQAANFVCDKEGKTFDATQNKCVIKKKVTAPVPSDRVLRSKKHINYAKMNKDGSVLFQEIKK